MAGLTDAAITARRQGYACCAAEFSNKAIEAALVGDKQCYDQHMRIAAWYAWGASVMARTHVDSDSACCSTGQCVTREFALSTIYKIDALSTCIKCGCGAPDDIPLTCDITPDISVYQALDALDETAIPNVAGRQTLIISNNTGVVNNWSTHLGEIATDDGAGNFTYTTPPDETVVFGSAQNSYYQTYPGGAGPYFPIIDGDQTFAILTLVSRTPQITLSRAFTVIVEVSVDGLTGWVPVYSGPETSLAYGEPVTLTPGFSPEYTRTTYFYGEESQCTAGPFVGSIPPFVFPPCGILEYEVTPESICNSDDWRIGVEFTQVDGWTLGTVTPTVNGVAGTPQNITLGTLTFGPYVMGDLVTLELVNNLDGACDITTQTYADPRVGEQDFTVLRAVDADEYAALNGDGNDYYIVSDLNGSADPWAANVGSIWLGASSTYQLVTNLEIVYASNPGGALGFWQDDGGTPLQMFPQPTFTLNTVTLIPVATLPTLPPFTLAWGTLFITANCPSSSVVVHTGTPASFTSPDPFALPACAWASVTGTAVYSDGCAVPVPAITDTFTPTGPDPDVISVGLNAGINSSAAAPLPAALGSFYVGGFFTAYDPAGANIPAQSFTRLLTDLSLDVAFNANVTDTSFMRVVGAGDAGSIGKYLQGPNVNGKPSYTFAGTDNYSISWSGTQWDIRNVTTAALLYHSVNDTPFPSLATTWLADTGALPVPTVTSGGFDLDLRDLAVDSQGRIVCVGSFGTLNDFVCPRIVRINPDGTRDATFNVGTGFNAVCTGVSIDSADRVVCTGSFTSYNSIACGFFIRLNTDGSIDTTFNYNNTLPLPVPYAGFDFRTYRNIINPDGTIYVNSGQQSFEKYTSAAGTVTVMPTYSPTKKGVVRINADGTLNAAVTQGGVLDGPTPPIQNGFSVQPDGKIICVGSFLTYDGVTVNCIMRMDQFGTLDTAFCGPTGNTGTGFDSLNAQATSAGVMPNGQIMVSCGVGVTFNGGPATGGLIRLNADGTLDNTFNIGAGFAGASGIVVDITVTTLGDTIVSGSFTTLDGQPRPYVAKF